MRLVRLRVRVRVRVRVLVRVRVSEEEHAPLPRRITSLEAAHQCVQHRLAAPVRLVEQRVLLPQLELRRPPHLVWVRVRV